MALWKEPGNKFQNPAERPGFWGNRTVKNKMKNFLTQKSEGIDGLLVTVGLCIIALLLCVVMKDSLTAFISQIVTALQTKALGILG